MNNFNQSYYNGKVIEAIIINDNIALKKCYDEFLSGPAIMKFVEITSFEDTKNKTYDIIISKGIRLPEHLANAFLAPDDVYISMINNGYLSKYDQVMVNGYVLVRQEDLFQRDIKSVDFKHLMNYPMSASGYGYLSPNPPYQYPAYTPMYSSQYSPVHYNPYMNGPYSSIPLPSNFSNTKYNESCDDHNSDEKDNDDWKE